MKILLWLCLFILYLCYRHRKIPLKEKKIIKFAFIFIKTRKTGSSTIANMLHNMALRHGLKVANAKPANFIQEALLSNPYPAHIWANHLKEPYSEKMRNIVPNGHFLTIVREPLQRLLSHIHFFHNEALFALNCDINAFIKKVKHPLEHTLAFDLNIHNLSDINNSMSHMDVFVLEDLYKSLFLWRKKYQLSYNDILFFPKKINNTTRQGQTEKCPKIKINDLVDENVRFVKSEYDLDFKLYASTREMLNKQWKKSEMTEYREMKIYDLHFAQFKSKCSTSETALCVSARLDNRDWMKRFQKYLAQSGHV